VFYEEIHLEDVMDHSVARGRAGQRARHTRRVSGRVAKLHMPNEHLEVDQELRSKHAIPTSHAPI